MPKPAKPASAEQSDFLADLLPRLAEADVAAIVENIEDKLTGGTLTNPDASAAIDFIRRYTRPPVPKFQIPAGRYLVDIGTAKCAVRVSSPTEGEWAGRNFIRPHKGGAFPAAELRDITQALSTPARIYSDALAYGREFGTCWCGKQLVATKDRTIGIHPDCLTKI